MGQTDNKFSNHWNLHRSVWSSFCIASVTDKEAPFNTFMRAYFAVFQSYACGITKSYILTNVKTNVVIKLTLKPTFRDAFSRYEVIVLAPLFGFRCAVRALSLYGLSFTLSCLFATGL